MENNSTPTQPSINMSVNSVPRVTLEILVYGYENPETKKPKEDVSAMIKDLQRQIDKSKLGQHIRVFYFIGDSEKTPLDCQHFLESNANAKYIVYANKSETDYSLSKTFVSECEKAIKRLESTLNQIKSLGITISKK